MLGLDTNVLVRYLVRDDERHFERARRLIERTKSADEEVFVNLLVLQETEWVLRSRYGFSKTEIREAIGALLDTTDVGFEDEPTLEAALFVWKHCSAEFSDCLIGARNRRLGCRSTATFDERAATIPLFIAA
jgi:predicted nucleic-acid-binding protein